VELAAELDDAPRGSRGNLSELRIGLLVPGPEKVLGVSYNYNAHASQEGVGKF
jgi:hypothetical protein